MGSNQVHNLFHDSSQHRASQNCLTYSRYTHLCCVCIAFLKLPSDELARLGVDVHHDYVAGTPEAESLQIAWTQRQKELKEMMDKQLKAADYMGTLAGHLVNSSVSDEEVVFHLSELEQLLSDIDNARDFHNIGGWPSLTSLLPGAHGTGAQERSLAVQSMASHCIGTAVKNDYDFQLWVLEEAGQAEGEREGNGQAGGRTVVNLLLSALHDTSQRLITTNDLSEVMQTHLDELLRRLLYALSASIRGNLDVQAAVSPSPPSDGGDQVGSEERHPSFVNLLQACVEAPALSVGVKRKCWHMVSDLLDEMVYIRHDVVQEYAAMQQAQQEQSEVEVGVDGVQTSAGKAGGDSNILNILKTLRPMGMVFLTPQYDWMVLAADVAAEIASTCALGDEGPAAATVPSSEEDCVLRTNPQVRDIFAHVVKIKTILRTEFGLDGNEHGNFPSKDGTPSNTDILSSSAQLMHLKQVEEQYGVEVDSFLKHPLMQDKLY